jgi:tRNA splicing endonuclease
MEKVIVKEINGKFYVEKDFYDKIGRIGKLEDKYILLEPEEVLYGLKKGWLELENIKNFVDFIKNYKEKINMKKYYIFEDLRNKGYYVGIYNDLVVLFKDWKKDKVEYYIYPIFENEFIDFSILLNIMNENKENKILLAIIDIENDIVYYEVNKINL